MLPLQSLGLAFNTKDNKKVWSDGEHPAATQERVAATHDNRFLHGSFAGFGGLGEMDASGQDSLFRLALIRASFNVINRPQGFVNL
jgi:hypothetical protein